MKRIFWIGSPFFSHALQDLFKGRVPFEGPVASILYNAHAGVSSYASVNEGAASGGGLENVADSVVVSDLQNDWEICIHNFEHTAVWGWEDIVATAGWEPDVVVVADKSRTPFVLGMESFPCLTVFYCVDSHIHSWYPYYAQAFDVCLMSLKDHMPLIQGKRLAADCIWWSPAFAKAYDVPVEAEQEWDVLFVGTVSDRTPQRKIFLEALGKRVNLRVTQGLYRELYPQAKIVLNYSEHGDLNFRVFETLGCGKVLLTPRVGHGLADLFTEGKDCAMYEEDNLEEAVVQIQALLADEPLRKKMAESGGAKVDALHRDIQRARLFMHRIEKLDVPSLVARRLEHQAGIREEFLRFVYLLHAESVENVMLKKAYLAAAAVR